MAEKLKPKTTEPKHLQTSEEQKAPQLNQKAAEAKEEAQYRSQQQDANQATQVQGVGRKTRTRKICTEPVDRYQCNTADK